MEGRVSLRGMDVSKAETQASGQREVREGQVWGEDLPGWSEAGRVSLYFQNNFVGFYFTCYIIYSFQVSAQ